MRHRLHPLVVLNCVVPPTPALGARGRRKPGLQAWFVRHRGQGPAGDRPGRTVVRRGGRAKGRVAFEVHGLYTRAV